MARINLYVLYDSVTNYVMTRGINLVVEDFQPRYLPTNMILSEASAEVGRFDTQTNFKVLRTQGEVVQYFEKVQSTRIRIANWIDFENIESMHQLSPNEIAEILYLFHAHKALKSAFSYKLQNNYVYLTLPNGLLKIFYRYVKHFYPRFQRVVKVKFEELINESQRLFFMKKTRVKDMPEKIVEQLAPLFSDGLKVNFEQAIQTGSYWKVPLDIIEDNLTLINVNQLPKEHIGFIIYDTNAQTWSVELDVVNVDDKLEELDE